MVISWYKADSWRLNADCEVFERLVIACHRMHQFHIRDQVIIDEYMTRMANNNWDKAKDRDDNEFLQWERTIWAKMNPSQAMEEDDCEDSEKADSEHVMEMTGSLNDGKKSKKKGAKKSTQQSTGDNEGDSGDDLCEFFEKQIGQHV